MNNLRLVEPLRAPLIASKLLRTYYGTRLNFNNSEFSN
jgi:hypothetical protein